MSHYFYARTSTDRQDNGMEDQVRALEAWAEYHKTPCEVLTEQASAKTLRARPVLHGILGQLGEGDKLVITALSRLSRNIADFTSLLDRAQRGGWGVIVIDLGGNELDTTTATGRFAVRMLMEVAQWENEVRGERIRAALAIRKEAGVQLGNPSTVPEETKQLIATLRDGSGLSWKAVADKLNEDGVPSPSGNGRWHPTSVKRHVAEASGG